MVCYGIFWCGKFFCSLLSVVLFFQLEAYVHPNAEITYLFTQPIRVDRTLGHSGEQFQKDGV